MEELIKIAQDGGWEPKIQGTKYDVPWFDDFKSRWLSIKPTTSQKLQSMSYSAGYGQGFGDALILLDPLFYQALSKVAGWGTIHDGGCDSQKDYCFHPEGGCNCEQCDCDARNEWKYYALRTLEIILTEGMDKGIEYLKSIVVK